MRKWILLIAALSLITLAAADQDYKGRGRVSGTVVDAAGNPIEGVRVKMYAQRFKDGFEVKTDAKGNWTAAWIRGGEWDIDFELYPYIPRKISVTLNEHARNKPIEIVLEKAEQPAAGEGMREDLIEGNRLFDEEKYQESIAVFEKILADHPDAFIMNLNIGNAYFQMDDLDRAEEYYRKVLESEPDNVEAVLAVANCHISRGDDEKAKEMYGLLNMDQIEDPTVLYNIGTNHYAASNFQEAEKYYRKAVTAQPDFLDGYYQLGLTLLNMNQKAEAIATFEKYLEIDSDSAKAEQVKGFIEYLKK